MTLCSCASVMDDAARRIALVRYIESDRIRLNQTEFAIPRPLEVREGGVPGEKTKSE